MISALLSSPVPTARDPARYHPQPGHLEGQGAGRIGHRQIDVEPIVHPGRVMVEPPSLLPAPSLPSMVPEVLLP
jgi:hypothetical protein